jgi:signal transduction histidine kinase
MAEFDAIEAIAHAVATTRGLFAERSIALEVDLPERMPPVYADRDRLIQVVVNLLSNAVKFCEPGHGRVLVAADRTDGELRVAIADNGPGIPVESRVKVFERFHQLHAPEAAQGTGLGLAISRQIVEHFGGRIWVETAPGGGARFIFALPLVQAVNAAAK